MLNIWREASMGKHIVADVGGYDGIFGIIAALGNPLSSVYIFEPEPINFKQIQKNIELNKLSNVKLVESAVSDQHGTVHFDRHIGGTGGKIANKGYEVRCTTLDTFFSGKPQPTLMKIDIEGAEGRALSAAGNLLASKPAILLEAHWAFLPRYGDSLQSILTMVNRYGYKTLWLDETHVANHYWLY